tara:strand:- start:224 stop:613 length:390 start_codon:yes stop_codon:yes gene_type:complete
MTKMNQTTTKTPQKSPQKKTCQHKYNGWGCFIVTAMFVFIAILLVVGLGGPKYHDCENNDCERYYYYGLYCYDYCWYGNYGPTYGPGNTLAVFTVLGLSFVCFIPFCWIDSRGRKDRRDFNTLQSFNDI